MNHAEGSQDLMIAKEAFKTNFSRALEGTKTIQELTQKVLGTENQPGLIKGLSNEDRVKLEKALSELQGLAANSTGYNIYGEGGGLSVIKADLDGSVDTLQVFTTKGVSGESYISFGFLKEATGAESREISTLVVDANGNVKPTTMEAEMEKFREQGAAQRAQYGNFTNSGS